MNLEALVAPLRADVVSGAAVVARAAAAAMRRGAIQLDADSSEELRARLEALSVRVIESQPAMAPLVHLITDVLGAVDPSDPLDEARRRAAEATEAFRDGLERRSKELASSLSRALPEGKTILTLSSSSTVRSGLLEAKTRGISVICLESRPMNEGQALARTLAQAGIPVTLAVDAAAESMVPQADVVLLGADSIGDAGIVNKIGSLSLARAAAAHEVPVWIAADRSKWLPPGFPQFLHDDRPAEEVWRGSRGVAVWNRYFECLDFELMDGLVCGTGFLSPAELHERRAEIGAAPVLMDWAAQRSD